MVTGEVATHQRSDNLIAIPICWACWLFLFALVANMLFGKTRIVLDANEFKSVWTGLFIREKKRFDLTDIRRFETKIHRHNRGPDTYSLRIVLQKDDARFSVPADKEELDDLCRQLNALLKTLKQSGER